MMILNQKTGYLVAMAVNLGGTTGVQGWMKCSEKRWNGFATFMTDPRLIITTMPIITTSSYYLAGSGLFSYWFLHPIHISMFSLIKVSE